MNSIIRDRNRCLVDVKSIITIIYAYTFIIYFVQFISFKVFDIATVSFIKYPLFMIYNQRLRTGYFIFGAFAIYKVEMHS